MTKLRLATRFVSLALIGSTVIAPVAQAAYSDVTGGEFAQYVDNLSSQGVISGNGGLFFPSRSLSRGELAKVLVKAANLTLVTSGSARFSDVPAGSTFYDYVMTLANRGTINGYSDGTFRPNSNVSRGEFSKMVVGAFGFTTNTASGPHFTADVPASQTFYAPIETLYALNVISGYNASFFGPNDPVTREQMAKIVSRAMMSKAGTLPPRAVSVDTSAARKQFALTFNYVFPRLQVTPSSSMDRVSLSALRFPHLEGDAMYQLWATDGTQTASVGRFNVRNSALVDNRDAPISNSFLMPLPYQSVRSFSVSVESSNIATTPSASIVVRGDSSRDEDSFDLDFPAGFGNPAVTASVLGSSGVLNDVLVLNFATLPDISGIGMVYQAWSVKDGLASSLGTFNGTGMSTLFRSSNLPFDLTQVQQIKVSVEPITNVTTSGFVIPWSGDVPGAPLSAATSSSVSSSPAHDQQLYRGLTTSLTTESLRARTVMEENATQRVIIQAYAGAPSVAEGEDQAIVVKVSDLTGKPISGLDLKLSRIDGPSARFTDPREVGSDTGVYIGNYTTDGTVSSTDEAVIRIQSDSSSSSDDDDVTVPNVEVRFSVAASSRDSDPRTVEVDVPRTTLFIDENSTTLNDADMIVLTIATDSNNRGILPTSLYSRLTLNSSNSSSTASATTRGNLKYFLMDDRFFGVNNEDDDIVVNRNFTVQLIPGSSDSFDPVISDVYTVHADFTARESD